MTLYVPYVIKQSSDCLIGDVEKFMELFEKGFYAAQWSRLHESAIKSILETPDVDLWANPIITDVDISNDRVE